jgi:hypothetical protein
MNITEDQQRELDAIAAMNNGMVSPRALVDAARDPESAWHDSFVWDQELAAEQYLVMRARELLRFIVRVEPVTKTYERVMVSLHNDRTEDGGYRDLRAVLNDDDLRAALLSAALRELNALRRRYAHLKELAGVFAALDGVAENVAA